MDKSVINVEVRLRFDHQTRARLSTSTLWWRRFGDGSRKQRLIPQIQRGLGLVLQLRRLEDMMENNHIVLFTIDWQLTEGVSSHLTTLVHLLFLELQEVFLNIQRHSHFSQRPAIQQEADQNLSPDHFDVHKVTTIYTTTYT